MNLNLNINIFIYSVLRYVIEKVKILFLIIYYIIKTLRYTFKKILHMKIGIPIIM